MFACPIQIKQDDWDILKFFMEEIPSNSFKLPFLKYIVDDIGKKRRITKLVNEYRCVVWGRVCGGVGCVVGWGGVDGLAVRVF